MLTGEGEAIAFKKSSHEGPRRDCMDSEKASGKKGTGMR